MIFIKNLKSIPTTTEKWTKNRTSRTSSSEHQTAIEQREERKSHAVDNNEKTSKNRQRGSDEDASYSEIEWESRLYSRMTDCLESSPGLRGSSWFFGWVSLFRLRRIWEWWQVLESSAAGVWSMRRCDRCGVVSARLCLAKHRSPSASRWLFDLHVAETSKDKETHLCLTLQWRCSTGNHWMTSPQENGLPSRSHYRPNRLKQFRIHSTINRQWHEYQDTCLIFGSQ